MQCVCVCMCVTHFRGYVEGTQSVAQDHPQVKLNNLDNLKSIDSAICPFIVIAPTPISVNGLVHLNLDGLSRCYPLSAMELMLNKEEKKPNGHFKAIRFDWSDGETLRGFNVPVCYF